MPLVRQYSNPSPLTDLLRQVREAFSLMANATPVMVGEQFLEKGAGSYPRVVFVPEPLDAPGKIGPMLDMGNADSMVHSCGVFVRSKESGDDIARFAAAYALADLVIDCVKTASPGHIEWGSLTNDSPTTANAFGAGLKFQFFYTRDIPHDAKRWALPAASSDSATQLPHPPPGVLGGAVIVEPTAIPQT